MAKKTTKNISKTAKTAAHDDFHWFYCTLVLMLALVGTVVLGGIRMAELKRNVVSYEEHQRLAVFENLAKSYIENEKIAPDSTVTMTGIGLSDDDEIYIGFSLLKAGEETAKTGRMYFQWDTERETWAHAFAYDE